MSPHLMSRATILGTGLIGGSFALALRKYATDLHISGWDRPEIAREARSRNILDESFSGDLAPVLRAADLIYIALPIGVTLDLLPEIARLAPKHALVTDACSTKVRIAQTAAENFSSATALFLGGHPMAGPGLRDSLRLAGSPYSTWRDIVLTNREVLSAALDLFARRLDDLRERLNSRELEADFDAANELYKLLRSL